MVGVRSSLLVVFVALAATAALGAKGSAPTSPKAPGPAPRAVAPAAKTASVSGAASPARATNAGPAAVTKVLDVAWGHDVGELGHLRPTEGSAEGPMSFVVDEDGRIDVLDQVNERVAIFAHGAASVVPIAGRTAQDLERVGGGYVLLDRLVRRALTFVDGAGRILHEVPLVGPGVVEGGGITGLFQRADGTWVEVEHQRLVRVADARGRADAERPTALGRFLGVGDAVIEARRFREAEIALRVSGPGGAMRALPSVSFAAPVAWVSGLEPDGSGRLFLGVVTRTELLGPADPVRNEHAIALLDAGDGRVLARYSVPAQDAPEETFRPVRAGADGALYVLRCTSQGAEMWKVTP